LNPDDSILAAGGFIFQLMPGTPDELISKLEERLKTIEPISKLIERGLSPEQILEELFGNENVKILETMPVSFECNCSKERFANAIIGLGAAEITAMIEEDGQAEAHCHFCNEKYQYSREELEALRSESK
jgi:molecular chaperone Hsp33